MRLVSELTHVQAFVLLTMFLVAVCGSSPARAASSKTAVRCGVDQDQPPDRVFADFDGRGNWREYTDAKSLPVLDFGASSVKLWSGTNDRVLISVYQPNEDFAFSTEYCFDKPGRLVQLRYQLRTVWGWGYRVEGPLVKGKVQPDSSEFFDTETDQPVPRPESAGDVPHALRPHVYRVKSELPFFALLSS